MPRILGHGMQKGKSRTISFPVFTGAEARPAFKAPSKTAGTQKAQLISNRGDGKIRLLYVLQGQTFSGVLQNHFIAGV